LGLCLESVLNLVLKLGLQLGNQGETHGWGGRDLLNFQEARAPACAPARTCTAVAFDNKKFSITNASMPEQK
jgi:hypothetical protein